MFEVIINRPGDRYHQRIYNKRCKVYKVIDDSQFMYGFLVYLEGNWEIISPKFCAPVGEKQQWHQERKQN